MIVKQLIIIKKFISKKEIRLEIKKLLLNRVLNKKMLPIRLRTLARNPLKKSNKNPLNSCMGNKLAFLSKVVQKKRVINNLCKINPAASTKSNRVFNNKLIFKITLEPIRTNILLCKISYLRSAQRQLQNNYTPFLLIKVKKQQRLDRILYKYSKILTSIKTLQVNRR